MIYVTTVLTGQASTAWLQGEAHRLIDFVLIPQFRDALNHAGAVLNPHAEFTVSIQWRSL